MVDLFGDSALVGDISGKIQNIDLATGITGIVLDGIVGWSDVALNSSGSLYGVSSNGIYLIDTDFGTSTFVLGIPSATDVNALTFGSDGFLYAFDTNTTLSKIDVSSLAVIQVTTSASSGGAVVFVQGQLMAVADGSLLRIDTTTGATTTLAGLDRTDVTGLSVSDSGQLVGYSSDDVFTIDTDSGVTTSLFDNLSTLSFVSGATSDNDFSAASIGSSNADTVAGTANADVVSGGGGDDVVTAGSGADVVYGNTGSDIIYGNKGSDLVFGGQDSDSVFGGQGNDFIYGNFGADVLYGNLGVDYMYGGRDNDVMFGGQGNDVLQGNVGNDTLAGNLGNDLFYGGSGDDRFDLTGNDTVWDFSKTDFDTLYNVTASYSVTSGFDISAGVSYSDYAFENGNSVRLIGVDASFDISVRFAF